jgi:hypothetical protein
MRVVERVGFWAAAGVGSMIVVTSFIGLCVRHGTPAAAASDMRDLGVGLALVIVALLVNVNASLRTIASQSTPVRNDGAGRNGERLSTGDRLSAGRKKSPLDPIRKPR